MALHPTLSESCFKNSIKKFFVDRIQTIEGIDIDFDVQYVQPEDVNGELPNWMSVKFGKITGGTLAKAYIVIYIFTRKDSEGVDLSTLRDIILDTIVDLEATDGKVRIPFYDLEWNQIGAMLPSLTLESDEPGTLKDTTKFKWMRIDLCWGAK